PSPTPWVLRLRHGPWLPTRVAWAPRKPDRFRRALVRSSPGIDWRSALPVDPDRHRQPPSKWHDPAGNRPDRSAADRRRLDAAPCRSRLPARRWRADRPTRTEVRPCLPGVTGRLAWRLPTLPRPPRSPPPWARS